MAAWQNRITGYGEEAPDQLAANPRNWRVHPQHQQAALEGVQVPVTAHWNEAYLRDAGFRSVECFWRWCNFAAWIAIRT